MMGKRRQASDCRWRLTHCELSRKLSGLPVTLLPLGLAEGLLVQVNQQAVFYQPATFISSVHLRQ
jgi:hypothetical protein